MITREFFMITREFFKWLVSFIMAVVVIALIIAGFDQPMIWAVMALAILTSIIRFKAFK